MLAVSIFLTTGPFSFAQTIIAPFAHNPTVRQLPDGTFVLFMIGRQHSRARSGSSLFGLSLWSGGTPSTPVHCDNSTTPITRNTETFRHEEHTRDFTSGIRVSAAPSVSGPWSTPVAINFTSNSDLLHGGWTNPSPHFYPNGSLLLAYQAQPDPNTGRKRSWELVL